MQFYEKLLAYRKRAHLTQNKFAKLLHVSRQTVFKWENGLVYPTFDKIFRLCEQLNVSIDDLLSYGPYRESSTYEPLSTVSCSATHVGENIKAYRYERGLSQDELGERLHVTRQTVSRWETGIILPDLVNMMVLADFFSVPTSSLISPREPAMLPCTAEPTLTEAATAHVQLAPTAEFTSPTTNEDTAEQAPAAIEMPENNEISPTTVVENAENAQNTPATEAEGAQNITDQTKKSGKAAFFLLSILTLFLVTAIASFLLIGHAKAEKPEDDTPPHTEGTVDREDMSITENSNGNSGTNTAQSAITGMLDGIFNGGCYHIIKEIPAVAATCSNAGLTAGSYCVLCGEILAKRQVVPATGHTEKTLREGVAPTCTEAGRTASTYCPKCHMVINEVKVLSPLSHDLIIHPAKEPTCLEAGFSEESYCANCPYVASVRKVLAMLSHTYANGTCACGASDSTGTLAFTITNESSCTVTGLGTWEGVVLRIPETYQGYPVTEIAAGVFENHETVTEVIIPDSVISIGARAFAASPMLKKVTLGTSVASLGEEAFLSCNRLESINLDNTVTEVIGSRCFQDCSRLHDIALPSSLTKIGASAFSGCKSIVEMILPDSLVAICKNAFADCPYALYLYTGSTWSLHKWALRQNWFNNEATVICQNGVAMLSTEPGTITSLSFTDTASVEAEINNYNIKKAMYKNLIAAQLAQP